MKNVTKYYVVCVAAILIISFFADDIVKELFSQEIYYKFIAQGEYMTRVLHLLTMVAFLLLMAEYKDWPCKILTAGGALLYNPLWDFLYPYSIEFQYKYAGTHAQIRAGEYISDIFDCYAWDVVNMITGISLIIIIVFTIRQSRANKNAPHTD